MTARIVQRIVVGVGAGLILALMFAWLRWLGVDL